MVASRRVLNKMASKAIARRQARLFTQEETALALKNKGEADGCDKRKDSEHSEPDT